MSELQSEYTAMQTVKRRFFAMRNGVIADTLRKAGSPFKFIFGLNLPQLVEIAAEFGPDTQLAEELWENTNTRESMLLAPMVRPHESFGRNIAEKWIAEVTCAEVADILCHKLLKYQPYAPDLAEKLADCDDELQRYTGLRLMFNITFQYPERALALAQKVLARSSVLTDAVARSLKEEAEYLLESRD